MIKKKGLLSRGVRHFRQGLKTLCTTLVGKVCGRRAFSLFGVPAGLTSEGVEHLDLFYPSETLKMTPPKTVEPTLAWEINALINAATASEEGIFQLKGGLSTSSGGNLSPQGKLITTFLQPIDGKPPHKNDLMIFSAKKFFPRIYHTKELVITLTTGWQGAFYHWIYEALPRLHLAEKGGYSTSEARIYVDQTFPFQRETLALMGIPKEQLIEANMYGAVSAPSVVVPSIPLTPRSWSCQFLREKILPKLASKPPLRLYISRNDAARRRIVNEEEVFALLRTYGFVKAELSGLPFKEQAELFKAAEVVIGPHGAGFSHIVFCAPGTRFLEIFSPAYLCPCYWHVSDRVGLDYYYLFGEGERLPNGIQANSDPDITLDLKKLEASLKLMGLSNSKIGA